MNDHKTVLHFIPSIVIEEIKTIRNWNVLRSFKNGSNYMGRNCYKVSKPQRIKMKNALQLQDQSLLPLNKFLQILAIFILMGF